MQVHSQNRFSCVTVSGIPFQQVDVMSTVYDDMYVFLFTTAYVEKYNFTIHWMLVMYTHFIPAVMTLG